MKKFIALVLAIAVIASMGLVASFAAAPTGFGSSRSVFSQIWTRWGVGGSYGDWGGADGIGDKGTVCTSADQQLNFQALIAWADGVNNFPEITKVGYVIEGTTDVVWLPYAIIRDAVPGESVAFAGSPAPYNWGGTVIEIALDTSTLPAGTWNIYFVFEYAGNVYMLPENSATYVNQGAPVWPYTTVISSGANYGETPVAVIPDATYTVNFNVTDAAGGCDPYDINDWWGGGDLIGNRKSIIIDEDVMVVGWAGFGSYTIDEFGYILDEGTDNEKFVTVLENPATSQDPGVIAAAGIGAINFNFTIDTSALPAGDHVIQFAAKVADQIKKVGIRSDNGQCFTVTVTSSGADYAPEATETTLDTAQVDVFSKKVTVNVRLDLAASATNDDYTVVINGTEATLVNGTFISAPIDLNNIADEFDIELYDGEDLIDSVEDYSVKAYLESLDNKVCADVLALGSALDVYTGGEGFAVEGASAALEVAPTAPAKTAARDSADDYIKGATLLIDEDINIAFTLKTTNATSVVISADGFDDKIVDDIADKYVLTADIALADLATAFRADLMVEDTGVAYATYSALNYICKNYNNADAKLAAVCQALYAVCADLNVPEG